eukprot:gene7672-11769_t
MIAVNSTSYESAEKAAQACVGCADYWKLSGAWVEPSDTAHRPLQNYSVPFTLRVISLDSWNEASFLQRAAGKKVLIDVDEDYFSCANPAVESLRAFYGEDAVRNLKTCFPVAATDDAAFLNALDRYISQGVFKCGSSRARHPAWKKLMEYLPQECERLLKAHCMQREGDRNSEEDEEGEELEEDELPFIIPWEAIRTASGEELGGMHGGGYPWRGGKGHRDYGYRDGYRERDGYRGGRGRDGKGWYERERLRTFQSQTKHIKTTGIATPCHPDLPGGAPWVNQDEIGRTETAAELFPADRGHKTTPHPEQQFELVPTEVEMDAPIDDFINQVLKAISQAHSPRQAYNLLGILK